MRSLIRYPAWVGVWVWMIGSAAADPLVVGAGAKLEIGNPQQPTSQGYDSLTIEDGGELQFLGDLTLNIAGDITINGRISANPKAKPAEAPAGQDGVKGLDGALTGLNAGTGGILGGFGTNWTFGGAPRIELRSDGAVTIKGTIELKPEFEGGDGGRGGHGGDGGSGASGQPGDGSGGGFAGQAGTGGNGGHGGLPGATLRITGRTLWIQPGARILLNNAGKGGRGGAGGNAGHGGRGGDGPGGHGGNGGGGAPAGGGGDGGSGGNGGTLYLTADSVVVEGEISLNGGDGGDGGPAGRPGNGGDGGNYLGTQSGYRGGRGGDAGNPLGSGPRGGRGGLGGNGGALFIRAHTNLVLSGDISLKGGTGGLPGPGHPAEIAKGGKGGTGNPSGEAGLNSGTLLPGAAGADGREGTANVWTGFSPGPYWTASGSVECLTTFQETDLNQVTHQGLKICGGVCLSTFIATGTENPLELRFTHRWVTTFGALEFFLGEHRIHRLDAPAVLPTGLEDVRVVLNDPALRSVSLQEFKVCVSPEGAQVSLANVLLRPAPELNAEEPIITLQRSGNQLTFTWTALAGRDYQLQSRDSLTTGAWVDVGDGVRGAGSSVTATQAIAANDRTVFYRLRVTPSP